MRDFENYECEGQMELEDYLSLLAEEHRGNTNTCQNIDDSDVNGLKGSLTTRQHVDTEPNGNMASTTAHFVDEP